MPDFAFSEFKEMVSRFHAAGIEVILDVVYNHTCEGNEKGPTLSFKGIDNASFYRLLPDQKRFYINDTGTGNTLNLSNARVIQMVMDSLRYWVTEMHVDGFRFDLGTILARETYGFDQESGFLRAVGQDPVLSQVKMITEPWDCGPGGYQVGGFPPGWAEWNDRYRDNIRGYWKGDTGKIKDLATRFTGSSDFFNHRGRPAWSSVNFLTAHDGLHVERLGFVQREAQRRERRRQQGRQQQQRKLELRRGRPDRRSRDQRPARAADQEHARDVAAVPRHADAARGRDEFGRTQGGNNNAYCQDNEISWLNWNLEEKGRQPGPLRLQPHGPAPAPAHPAPVARFLTAEWERGTGRQGCHLAEADQRGDGPGGVGRRTPTPAASASCWMAAPRPSGIRRRGSDATVLVIMNSYHDGVSFKLPDVVGGLAWDLRDRYQHRRRTAGRAGSISARITSSPAGHC